MHSGHKCSNSMIAQDRTPDAVQRSHLQAPRKNVLERADHSMSIKSGHNDLEGSCISLDQVLSDTTLSINTNITYMMCYSMRISIANLPAMCRRQKAYIKIYLIQNPLNFPYFTDILSV